MLFFVVNVHENRGDCGFLDFLFSLLLVFKCKTAAVPLERVTGCSEGVTGCSANQLLTDLREIIGDYPDKKKIIGESRELILERLKAEKGLVDWISLSSSLLFSAKYIADFEELTKQTLYNNIKQSDYNSEGYLEGVERVQMDYKDLFELYKKEENVVFLIDPPYLSTDCKTYSNMDCWKLGDYLDILKMLEDKPYFYFTSEKSQIIELVTWLSENGFKKNPFEGATTKIVQTSLNCSAKYKDIMIYKK